MYFQIENTPERLRKARKVEKVRKESPAEECPRLILAPFSRPPQVVFDNVVIGSSSERYLEVYNPLKQLQKVSLGKALPPGLVIHMPEECLDVEPETYYCLTLIWSPTQPTATRETIRFTNENKGRYDVIVVLKSVMNIKGKNKQPKGFKTSPGKIKKKAVSKKSPVAIYKKKAEIIYNKTTQVTESFNVVQSTQHNNYNTFNKKNISRNDYSIDSYSSKCPFLSPTSIEINTSELFSNMKPTKCLQETYDKSYNVAKNNFDMPNILRPSNKQNCDSSATDIFDNLTFTPLKSVPAKLEKLDNGPRIIISLNSDIDDSLNVNDTLDLKTTNKENETHTIVSVTSSQPANKWIPVHHNLVDNQYLETPMIQNKKHPNTSSPKELNSPNFSINTDFSRISDLSFVPQRCSTDRKYFPKINETQDILDEKVSSDTFTKHSPNTPIEPNLYQMNMERPPHYFNRDQPKVCRQTLFREYQQQREAYEKNYTMNAYDHNVWHNNMRIDVKSPTRSLTPPLQSIPEESVQFSDTQVINKTYKRMTTFTIDRTFDKTFESNSTSSKNTWSKKAIRIESDLWKVPIAHIKKSIKSKPKSKDSIGSKASNITFENNKSINQNITINQIGNVYSQSSTVDPFLSSTYFYDEEAVDKFEKEFKRWLNCVLTPPADLDSNVEQKIDVGKAWIENRNKEVPLAPTKEQVCSTYHDSHRLERLRRSARILLMSPEIAQVFQKLNAQIEKKLIAIRTDRNLHLDIGLQKTIMELLLSYNPLWLRIGLEAIYGIVLPLKSNSDIEGLTTFIIHRMFKNPHLKNKHSKSSAPNVLLPAYMEAIKKFTLKKFFMLVFFLDQAKQKKLISHDPCLFCRNAICKESREIIIRFTRELIAGIGDITRHLRPMGYVVCHKQSYLDEYKYAVHNLALDIRDGVRLTKVMEIILMKHGLLNQLRTPAISRLQKIHNVQVAFNALKEANFLIVGDITATDIADGHREKTLSLLWQIIHVFRAPLFEKAANVIQAWWRKKYDVIIEKRKEAEKVRQRLNVAASVIQYWWRRIQYNRQVEWKMQQITSATVVVQKYCRMWLCRTRLRKYKVSVLKIEDWYKSVLLMGEAKNVHKRLKLEREQYLHKCATIIQSQVRRWLEVKRYKVTIQRIVKVQSLVRKLIMRRQYMQLKKTVIYIQQQYKRKLQMRKAMREFAKQRRSVITIQSFYRMIKQRQHFLTLKKFIHTIEDRFIALKLMRNERNKYLALKKAVILMQALIRGKKCRLRYLKQRDTIILLQRKFRANLRMKKERANFLKIKESAIVLQTYTRSYLNMTVARKAYLAQRTSAILIQRFFRSYLLTRTHRQEYLQLRKASVLLQVRYRSLLSMRKERAVYLKLKNAAVSVQRRYRAQMAMRKCRDIYIKLQKATLLVQHHYRALIKMRKHKLSYLKLKSSCIKIQRAFRAYRLGKKQRQNYLTYKEAAIKIQNWIRSCKKGKEVEKQYRTCKQACVTIQRYYKAYHIGRKVRQEYIQTKTAVLCIQRFYRCYIETKIIRQEYIRIKTSTVKIQRFYRSYLETKKLRDTYLKIKSAVSFIEISYIRYKEYQRDRDAYLGLRKATLNVQSRYRSILAMRLQRNEYLNLKHSVMTLQQKYRALLSMRVERKAYLKLRSATTIIQTRFRAQRLMKQERLRYITILRACITIQKFYKAYYLGTRQRQSFMKLKESAITVQRRYKALLVMRRVRNEYLAKKTATIAIQRQFRARTLMLKTRNEYMKTLGACKTIQSALRAYLTGKTQRAEYLKYKTSVVLIQRRFRMLIETRKLRYQYIQLKNTIIMIQRRFRANKLALSLQQNEAAHKLQTWYRSIQKRDACRRNFLQLRTQVTSIQSMMRMYIVRKRFLELKTATVKIQRCYRSYKLYTKERGMYIQVRCSVIVLQSYVRTYIAREKYLKLKAAALTIQAAYKLKRQRDLVKRQREVAAVTLQKYIRRYLIQSWYRKYRYCVMYVQKIWRGKLQTRLIRCGYLQKKNIIIKIQSVARGYLVRKQIQFKKEYILKQREELKQHWAAKIIQALFRGHKARLLTSHDPRAAYLRRRWREGALISSQPTLRQRNEEAMDVLRNMCDIETVIRAFRSLELLTEVVPMMYDDNAASIVRRVQVYMSVTNRSISSIEMLKSASAILVNLARYRVTGPKIYSRDRLPPILKFMWRFSSGETLIFCILATYLWLYSKYDKIREDLTEFLHIPENHKMLITMQTNVERTKRMATNRNKVHKPQVCKFVPHTNSYSNMSICSTISNSNSTILLPSLEPDYGIVRIDRPRYFEDAEQAIKCLFQTYNL